MLALVLTACDSRRTAEFLGVKKQSPDEFTVISGTPLTIPPSFDLQPPKPGEKRVETLKPRQDARRAVFTLDGDTDNIRQQDIARDEGLSDGEMAFLKKVSALDEHRGIRELIDRESLSIAREDIKLIEKIIFWKDPPSPGTIVDAPAETSRIKENASLGKPITEGETSIINEE
ncbi:MAG: DUF3035 domain-containing protein [Pseudomonadota bacterium]